MNKIQQKNDRARKSEAGDETRQICTVANMRGEEKKGERYHAKSLVSPESRVSRFCTSSATTFPSSGILFPWNPSGVCGFFGVYG